jgi:hypothetical protein
MIITKHKEFIELIKNYPGTDIILDFKEDLIEVKYVDPSNVYSYKQVLVDNIEPIGKVKFRVTDVRKFLNTNKTMESLQLLLNGNNITFICHKKKGSSKLEHRLFELDDSKTANDSLYELDKEYLSVNKSELVTALNSCGEVVKLTIIDNSLSVSSSDEMSSQTHLLQPISNNYSETTSRLIGKDFLLSVINIMNGDTVFITINHPFKVGDGGYTKAVIAERYE